MLISNFPSQAGRRGEEFTDFLLAEHMLVEWEDFLKSIRAGEVNDVVAEWRLGFDVDPYANVDFVIWKIADLRRLRDYQVKCLFGDIVPAVVRAWMSAPVPGPAG